MSISNSDNLYIQIAITYYYRELTTLFKLPTKLVALAVIGPQFVPALVKDNWVTTTVFFFFLNTSIQFDYFWWEYQDIKF